MTIPRILTSIAFHLAWSSLTLAQSTAFTYQGKLTSNSSPAEGTHDFRFKMFDAATGGTQLGTTQCVDNLLVSGGVFTSTIDFGAQFVTTAGRFLEIQVRKDTGLNCSNLSGFVILSPRQPVTPVPSATHAKTAFALAAADGSPSNAVVVDNIGNVDIGTATPGVPLHIVSTSPVPAIHVKSPFAVMNLQDDHPDASQTGYVSYRNNTGTETAWMGFGSAGDPDFSIVNARPGGDLILSPFTGNVGIGTASPVAKLEVHGDIRLGSSGQYSAAKAFSPTRVVSGRVLEYGGSGSGYSVTKSGTGSYTLSFNPPFSSAPALIITINNGSFTDADIAKYQSFSNGDFGVITKRLDGSNTDSAFSFIAIGGG